MSVNDIVVFHNIKKGKGMKTKNKKIIQLQKQIKKIRKNLDFLHKEKKKISAVIKICQTIVNAAKAVKDDKETKRQG